METAYQEHSYLFRPGRWAGKGILTIIGGPSEPISLEMISSLGGNGMITAQMVIELHTNGHEEGLELIYSLTPKKTDIFDFVQYNGRLGELRGKGAVTKRSIVLIYGSDDGTYSGFEAMEQVDEDHYHLRSTLSVKGVPTSILEAAVHQLERE